MRILFTSILAVAATLVPMLALAGNQEMAEKVSTHLKESGRLSHYRIAVSFQNGVVTLKGQVHDADQMRTALKLAFETEGVTGVVNNMVVGNVQPAAAPTPAAGVANPLRRSSVSDRGAPLADNGADQSQRQGSVQRVSATEPAAADQQLVPVPNNGNQRPLRVAMLQPAPAPAPGAASNGVPDGPLPMYAQGGGGPAPARNDLPTMPNYAWPSYAAYPNYAAVTYPRQYSPTAWPYIGPFYPYPQVPLGWRKVTLQWDDGWWMLDFRDEPSCVWWK
jgi:hypothetical protein